jgi:iron-sulfur cluster repair protein YtfE (RIC family)
MEDVVALIDRIIEEHRAIIQKVQTLEQVANDAGAMVGLDKAKEVFVPGKFDKEPGLQQLQELMETIDQGLGAHFNREETGLLTAFENYGDRKLSSDFHSLVREHDDLRNRLARSREHVAELTGGGLSRHVWEASANDMRAYITHTRKLFQAHARSEQRLFRALREALISKKKGSD